MLSLKEAHLETSRSQSPLPRGRWYDWVRAGLCAAAVMSFAYFICGGPIFETNDDVAMWMVSSGNGSVDRPDEHLLFISFLLGKVLNVLYGVTQQIPFYGLMLAGSQFLALTVIARLLLNKNQKKTPFPLALLVLFFLTFRPVMLMQFTSTAALVAVAAALVLLVGLECKNSLSPRILIPSIALSGLASLIRPDSAKLVFILTGVVMLARCWNLKNRQRTVRALISLVIPLAFAFSLDALNNAYYAKDEWREFHHLNSYRFPLMVKTFDTCNEHVVSAVKSAGWSPVDLHMFEFWFIQDPETYSLDKIKQVFASVPRVSENFVAAIIRVWSVILNDVTILPMYGFIAYWLLQSSRSRLRLYPTLGTLSSFAVVATGVALIVYLPARVYASLLCLLGVCLVFYSTRFRVVKFRPIHLLLMALIVCLPSVVSLSLRCQDVSIKSKRLRTAIEALKPDPKKLFVAWAGEFPFELIRPFENVSTYLRGMRIVQIDCFGRCPHVQNRLRQQGIHSNSFLDGLTAPDVFVFCMQPVNGLVRLYVREHYGKDVRYETVYSDPAIPLQVTKFTTRPFKELTTKEYELTPGDDFALPSTENWKHKELEFTAKLGEVASYEIPRLAKSRLEYDDGKALDFKKYPRLLIDMKVDPWQVCMGWLLILVGDEKNKGNYAILSRPLINDGKMHTYSVRLDRFYLREIKKITLRPSLVSFTRSASVSFGKVVLIGRKTIARNRDTSGNVGDRRGGAHE